jgi:putative copper export protein/mono/diheme cytochrome c family protein
MMVPPFDLQGGVSLSLARGITVIALLSAFGTIMFRNVVAPKAFALMSAAETVTAKRQLLNVARASVAGALLGICLWLVTQSAFMADAGSVAAALAAVPTVVSKTVFGHVIALQAGASVGLALLLGGRDSVARQRAALVAATIAVALQAGHSHAFSMVEGPSLLLGFDVLHLLGAGAWLGGLIPLLVIIRIAPPKAGVAAARRFSPLGQICIAALLVSAAWQAWILVATIPGLVGTAYGWMVMVKTGLFAILLGFAYVHRYRFAPALIGQDPEAARRVLIRSIALQSVAAFAILAAAIVLSGLPPSMHVQPLWPFHAQLSLEAIREDADFRWDVIVAGSAMAASLLLVLASLVLRRFRIAALALALVVGWFALPQADLVLATAYPTSFYRSPTGFTPASIVTGAEAYSANCVACHGAGGHGDGVLAKTLPVPPADLTAAHLWMHQDGELFWWISHGIAAPEGGQAMPGFAAMLDEDTRWDLIDYIRAHNAGLTFGADGAWGRVIRAPAFSALCDDGRTRALADFGGAPLLLAIGAPPPAPPGIQMVAASETLSPAPGICVARDRLTARAFAIAAGQPGEADGALFLIDAQGLLRHAWLHGQTPDDAALVAALTRMSRHKVATALQLGGDMAGMKMDGMDMGGMKMGGMKMEGVNPGDTKMDGMKMDGTKMGDTKMGDTKMGDTTTGDTKTGDMKMDGMKM